MDNYATETRQGQNSSSGMKQNRIFVRSTGAWLVAAAVVLATSAAWAAAPYSKIVVFGDSLSDVGNEHSAHNNVISPNYYNYRNSNGLLWVDDLAARLGEPALTNSQSGGTNFAYGGATASNIGTWTPGLTSQVTTYLGGVSQRADPNALYVVWAGANDFFNTLLPGVAPNTASYTPTTNLLTTTEVNACSANAASWAGYVSGAVSTLYTAGARKFLVPNLPPLSKTPALNLNDTGLKNNIEAGVVNFNNALSSNLSALVPTRPGLDIRLLDEYSLFNQVIASPTSYFGASANVTAACYPPTGMTTYYPATNTYSANSNQYLFWDYIHPTAAAHMVTANAAALLVPEPGTLVLLAIGAGMGVALMAREGRGALRRSRTATGQAVKFSFEVERPPNEPR
jgi:phospholipase/lecithinase/hemolysin